MVWFLVHTHFCDRRFVVDTNVLWQMLSPRNKPHRMDDCWLIKWTNIWASNSKLSSCTGISVLYNKWLGCGRREWPPPSPELTSTDSRTPTTLQLFETDHTPVQQPIALCHTKLIAVWGSNKAVPVRTNLHYFPKTLADFFIRTDGAGLALRPEKTQLIRG